MYEDDFLLRQLHSLTETVAQVLKLAPRGGEVRDEEDLDDAYRRVLPVGRALFEELSAQSLIPLLGGSQMLVEVAKLQIAEGNLENQRGRSIAARRCFRRALIFLEHAATQTDVDAALIAALRAK